MTTQLRYLGYLGLWLVLIFLWTDPVQSQHDIYIVHIKTGAVRQVSSLADAGEFNPAWSPNDKKIAHIVIGGPAPEGMAIYITRVQSGESWLLEGAEGGVAPSWSPSGKKIAFARSGSVYIVGKNGGERQLIREDAFHPDWSPNGKRLVFHQASDGSIRTIDPEKGTETFVTYAAGRLYGSRPAWSPNGKWIAFTNDDDIWKVRVNQKGEPKGSPIQVTDGSPFWSGYPSWSQNSKTIAFNSNRDGDGDIWTIPAKGGAATKLTGLAGAIMIRLIPIAGDLWLMPASERRCYRNKRLRVKISPFQ
jgi:Tol biopolymer transport system component